MNATLTAADLHRQAAYPLLEREAIPPALPEGWTFHVHDDTCRFFIHPQLDGTFRLNERDSSLGSRGIGRFPSLSEAIAEAERIKAGAATFDPILLGM